MITLEKLMPFLLLALLLASGAVLYFALRVETRLAARKKINLTNYREKNNLFYIRRDFPVAVFAAACALATLVLTVFAIIDPVIRRYVVALLGVLLVNGVCAYFALTRQKYARDIRIFDGYYVKVADLLASKERTQKDVANCRHRTAELRSKLEGTLAGFNKNLTEPISASFVPELFTPIEKMVDSYLGEINRFTGEIEADFNRALELFLHEEVQPELQVMPLRSFDEGTVDDMLVGIKTSYGNRVATAVIERINRGAVSCAAALGNIMTYLHGLGVKVDTESLVRFMRASADFADRSALAEKLYENRQIPAAMVCEVLIPEEWEWAFAPGMAAAYNTKDLTAILTELTLRDRSGMAYLLLTQLDSAHLPILRALLRRIREGELDVKRNETVRQLEAFEMILNNEYAVGNTAAVFENIALMLFDRRTEIGLSDEEQARIIQVVNNEGFLDARREIAALYSKATAFGKALVESSTRVLLQYVMAPDTSGAFLDCRKLTALLSEYRFTLSFADLSVLRAVVAAWLLCRAESDAAKRAVLRELAALPVPGVPASEEDAPAAVGREILVYLSKNERVRLRSAIYRAESERLCLDRVLALTKGV